MNNIAIKIHFSVLWVVGGGADGQNEGSQL